MVPCVCGCRRKSSRFATMTCVYLQASTRRPTCGRQVGRRVGHRVMEGTNNVLAGMWMLVPSFLQYIGCSRWHQQQRAAFVHQLMWRQCWAAMLASSAGTQCWRQQCRAAAAAVVASSSVTSQAAWGNSIQQAVYIFS